METELKTMSRLVASKKRMTVEEICDALGLTRRQVLYRLEKINQVLRRCRVPEVLAGSVLRLEPETRRMLLKLAQGQGELHEYEFTPAQRQLVLYLMLFEGQDHLILNDFMDALDVSRNTVLADLRQLRESLQEQGIALTSDRKKGYQLTGSETAIRSRMVLEVMKEIVSIADVQLFDLFLENSGSGSFPETEAICLALAEEQHLRFAADRMTEFIYIYLFLTTRIRNTGRKSDVHVSMPDCPEKRFVHSLLEQTDSLADLGAQEEGWLTSWILGISFGSVYEQTEDCLLIADITGRIMSRFEQLTGLRAPNPEDMFVKLYSHIRPAYYRLTFGIPILNPLTEKVKSEYSHLYRIVARAVKPAADLAQKDFPEDEIAYLTMHFAALYEGMHPSVPDTRRHALILCLNGIGSSAILHAVLTELFPELEFETADSLHTGPLIRKPDIIFAARSLTRIPETDVPVVTVSPVMDEQEKFLVMREVNSLLGQEAGIPSVDMIMNTVRRYCRIQKEEELRHALSAMVARRQPAAENPAGDSLLSMMNRDMIQTAVTCTSRDEAVQTAYQPLLDQGMITEEYIRHTLTTMDLTGPYVVIAPGIALLHTAADRGALQRGLSLTVFDTPVAFGSPANDPVKVAFALSVPEGSPSHLAAMADLLGLLEDPSFYACCDTGDPEQIWHAVRAHVGSRPRQEFRIMESLGDAKDSRA